MLHVRFPPPVFDLHVAHAAVHAALDRVIASSRLRRVSPVLWLSPTKYPTLIRQTVIQVVPQAAVQKPTLDAIALLISSSLKL